MQRYKMRDMNEILNENIHICIIDRPIYKMEKNYFGTYLLRSTTYI